MQDSHHMLHFSSLPCVSAAFRKSLLQKITFTYGLHRNSDTCAKFDSRVNNFCGDVEFYQLVAGSTFGQGLGAWLIDAPARRRLTLHLTQSAEPPQRTSFAFCWRLVAHLCSSLSNGGGTDRRYCRTDPRGSVDASREAADRLRSDSGTDRVGADRGK